MPLTFKKISLVGMLLLLTGNAQLNAHNPITTLQNIPRLIEQTIDSGSNFIRGLIPGKITAGITVGLGAAYLLYIKAIQKDWEPTIKEARKVTKFLVDRSAAPGNELKYWNLKSIKLAQEVDLKVIYNKLRADKKHQEETEDVFIDRMMKEIAKEKAELDKILKKLNKCLDTCSILPSFKIVTKTELDPVASIIETEKNRLNIEQKELHDLSTEEFNAIQTEVEKKGNVSIVNPYRLMRYWLLPFEAKAINENWAIRLLIARLELLEAALTSRRNEANKLQS